MTHKPLFTKKKKRNTLILLSRATMEFGWMD